MKNKRLHSIFSVFTLVGLLMFFNQSCETDTVLISNPSFSGDYVLSYSKLPKMENNDEFKLGGFSSLDYLGRKNFLTVTNGGPRLENDAGDKLEVKYLAKDFEPEIVKLTLEDGKIKIDERIKVRSLFGTIYDGTPSQSYVEEKINLNNSDMNIENTGLDPEAITFDPYSNSYWLGDQYGPSILQATGRWGEDEDQQGNVVRKLSPYDGLRTVYQNHLANGGISGLELLNNETMIGVFENYLENYPIEVDSLGNIHIVDTLDIYKGRRRIFKVNPSDIGGTPEMGTFYEVMEESYDGVRPEDVHIGDIAIINDTTCILNEYGETNGNKRNLLVKAILPDSIWFSSLKEGVFGKSIETLTPHELDSAGLSGAVKREFVDLSVEMDAPPVGITILQDHKVALLKKNNFGIVNDNQDLSSYEIKEEDIIIKVLKLDELF
ncbi:MAG TPA: hypothetical protein VKP78_03525 [bacterium]|nr:hypothetical protein [bacterium]